MNIKKYFILILLMLIVGISGCATTYSSLKNRESGNMEIISASHSDVLSSAYEAITSEFPSANINEIRSYQSGFRWSYKPFLDKTDFSFLIKRVAGITSEGREVGGYAISITTSGTQGFVDARYVQPVVDKFDSILVERGIEKLQITKVTYSKNAAYENRATQGAKNTYKSASAGLAENVRNEYAQLKHQFKFKENTNINNDSYALIIGINKYVQNSNVEYADYSALAFEELAHTTFGLPKENIITLLNNKASSGQLKSKVELVKELVEKGSNLYFYYAGHGVPGKDGSIYLLPSDMSADSIHLEPNLKLDVIYKNLSLSLADNVYVFMDACFSGKDDTGKLLYKGVAPVLRAKKHKVESKKLIVFTAGKSTDFANDFEEKKQRLFSYYLINNLSGGSKNLKDVYESVRRDVKRKSLMKGIGYKQVPQLYGDSSRELY